MNLSLDDPWKIKSILISLILVIFLEFYQLKEKNVMIKKIKQDFLFVFCVCIFKEASYVILFFHNSVVFISSA